MKLSIIVPVYNEERTVIELLNRLKKENIPNIAKEIIVVNDGSSDNTQKLLEKYGKKNKTTILLKHIRNLGKGQAVRTGIKKATGEYILIQDADLEYHPRFIKTLVKPIQDKKAEIVYGTRIKRAPNLKGEEKTFQFLLHYLGNRFLSLITSVFYGQWITDMETCYKLFPKKTMEHIKLNAKGFELEPEITAKLLKTGYKILEVPIKATPRGYDEGKKINTVKDGMKALWSLLKYRFIN